MAQRRRGGSRQPDLIPRSMTSTISLPDNHPNGGADRCGGLDRDGDARAEDPRQEAQERRGTATPSARHPRRPDADGAAESAVPGGAGADPVLRAGTLPLRSDRDRLDPGLHDGPRPSPTLLGEEGIKAHQRGGWSRRRCSWGLRTQGPRWRTRRRRKLLSRTPTRWGCSGASSARSKPRRAELAGPSRAFSARWGWQAQGGQGAGARVSAVRQDQGGEGPRGGQDDQPDRADQRRAGARPCRPHRHRRASSRATAWWPTASSSRCIRAWASSCRRFGTGCAPGT
jgi:hypothetical protein